MVLHTIGCNPCPSLTVARTTGAYITMRERPRTGPRQNPNRLFRKRPLKPSRPVLDSLSSSFEYPPPFQTELRPRTHSHSHYTWDFFPRVHPQGWGRFPSAVRGRKANDNARAKTKGSLDVFKSIAFLLFKSALGGTGTAAWALRITYRRSTAASEGIVTI